MPLRNCKCVGSHYPMISHDSRWSISRTFQANFNPLGTWLNDPRSNEVARKPPNLMADHSLSMIFPIIPNPHDIKKTFSNHFKGYSPIQDHVQNMFFKLFGQFWTKPQMSVLFSPKGQGGSKPQKKLTEDSDWSPNEPRLVADWTWSPCDESNPHIG